MSDLIDRQAALDALDSETVSTNPEHFKSNEKFIKFMDDADIASFGKWQWANGFNTALVASKIQFEKLPPAQPEVLACGNGELVAQPEPTGIDAREAVYNLAEKIGIHQLYALTVELRGEPIQPEPHEGQWIEDDKGNVYCSKCGLHTTKTALKRIALVGEDKPKFCPNCGTKMTTSTK